nr:hypothetical protein [Tanacetum cinerariifolium]
RTQKLILSEVSTQEPIVIEISNKVTIVEEVETQEPIVAEVGTQKLSVEDVVVEDYVSSEENGEDVEQGNGHEDESTFIDEQ